MEVGSAVLSILASGGPIAIAERVGAFLAIHGLEEMNNVDYILDSLLEDLNSWQDHME